MQWLRNTWYAAMFAEELVAGKMEARTILGERLVLSRNDSGEVFALEDRCPHRNVPLSVGKVLEGGRIMCGYHGLEFDSTGACVKNPHGNGNIPKSCAVRSFPTTEKYALIWVWMGDAEPDLSLIPDLSMFDPATSAYIPGKPGRLRMEAPWYLIVDNLMDLSHASFLHDGLLGNEDMTSAETLVHQEGNAVTVSRVIRNTRPPKIFDLMMGNDGARIDMWNDVTWHPPCTLILDVCSTYPGMPREGATGNFAAHILTPESESSTLYHYISVRNNPLPRTEDQERELAEELAQMRQKAFVGQDAPMIRAQFDTVQHYGGEIQGVMLSVDTGVVRWRRVMEALVQDES